MSATRAARQWTYADYARLPDDGNRYEVIDGEVYVTPAPGTRHQRVAVRLFMQLYEYVKANGLGEMIWDIDLLFQSGQYFRPDLLFVPREAGSELKERGMYGTPGLVVEVLSPGSRRLDRVKKATRYRDFGVTEYWVVDPVNQCIERHRLSDAAPPLLCRETLLWQPYADAPALELAVQAIFPAA
ncbi:MAG TPA: Uma2 family endonuclease [Longimicrobiales bacterium]|nr:Uma2 family endonuclease [Longimicrobiales bacterium]